MKTFQDLIAESDHHAGIAGDVDMPSHRRQVHALLSNAAAIRALAVATNVPNAARERLAEALSLEPKAEPKPGRPEPTPGDPYSKLRHAAYKVFMELRYELNMLPDKCYSSAGVLTSKASAFIALCDALPDCDVPVWVKEAKRLGHTDRNISSAVAPK